MFGPLPRLYRLVTTVAVVLAFLGSGAWLGHLTVVPVPLPLGALLGALAGVAVAWALVHDFHGRPSPHAVRGR